MRPSTEHGIAFTLDKASELSALATGLEMTGPNHGDTTDLRRLVDHELGRNMGYFLPGPAPESPDLPILTHEVKVVKTALHKVSNLTGRRAWGRRSDIHAADSILEEIEAQPDPVG